MEIWLHSNPKYTKRESIPIKYDINPGITMLIGPNGSGKTTALSQLRSLFSTEDDLVKKWNKLEINDSIRDLYSSYLYDNVYEETFTKSTWGATDHIDRVAQTFENSEGQNMYDYLYYKINEIGQAVTKAIKNNKKGIFLLFDGLDSGLSLDVINTIRKSVLEFIIETEKKRSNLEVYIICSANSYEFCNNYDCIDVTNQKHITFTNYEDYEKYFVKEDK